MILLQLQDSKKNVKSVDLQGGVVSSRSQNFATMYMMRVTGVSRKPDVGFPQVLDQTKGPYKKG